MYGYIYKTTNLINGKIYIGRHHSSVFEPDQYKGSGKLISRAIKKYGWDNFNCEILETCETEQELYDKEIYWIEKLNTRDSNIGYNIAKGGQHPLGGSKKGRKLSEQCRQRMSATRTGMKIGPCSEERKKNISNAKKGRKMSAEARRRISEGHKGKKLSDEAKQRAKEARARNKMLYPEKYEEKRMHRKMLCANKVWMTNDIAEKLVNKEEVDMYILQGFHIGRRPVSDETRKKIGKMMHNAMIGRKKSDLEKQRISESRQRLFANGFKGSTYDHVWINNGEEYCCPHKDEAEKLVATGKWKYGAKPMSQEKKNDISNKRKGYKWMYKDNVRIQARPEDVNELLQQGWRLGQHE